MGEVAIFPDAKEPEFKDGDDGDGTVVGGIEIEPVDNGFIVHINSDDGDIKLIAADKGEVIKIIKEWL